MQLSAFGEQFTRPSGIVDLMVDIGDALAENPELVMMGGGNPANIEAVEQVLRPRLRAQLDSRERFHAVVGRYQSPQGDRAFRSQIATYLHHRFGWSVRAENIAVSNGSQAAFFVLFNLLAGRMSDGSRRTLHLPVAPEYLGYDGSGLDGDLFTASRPEIELLPGQQFKYHVTPGALEPPPGTAALCVSRPTNPTGNVLTDDEMAKLDATARRHGIPLLIDGAYGLPFPNIVYGDATPLWNENIILALSLSKLGLPGLRTGIIVASERIVEAYTRANTIMSLACGSVGPALATELLADGTMDHLSAEFIRPWYQARAQHALARCHTHFGGRFPYRIHRPEGAFFLWLWFPELPIDSGELYRLMKKAGVVVVPGDHCFIGLDEDWSHRRQCLRVSYALDDASIDRGFELMASVLDKIHRQRVA